MKRSITLLCLLYSAISIAVAFLAHASLYFGFNLKHSAPTLWLLLHLSVAVSGLACIFSYRSPPDFRAEIFNEHSTALLCLTALFIIFLPYALFNFFYTSSLLHEGYLGVVDGKHVILLRSEPIMTLGVDELPRYELYEARKYSGHWMICHVLACVMSFVNFKWGYNN